MHWDRVLNFLCYYLLFYGFRSVCTLFLPKFCCACRIWYIHRSLFVFFSSSSFSLIVVLFCLSLLSSFVRSFVRSSFFSNHALFIRFSIGQCCSGGHRKEFPARYCTIIHIAWAFFMRYNTFPIFNAFCHCCMLCLCLSVCVLYFSCISVSPIQPFTLTPDSVRDVDINKEPFNEWKSMTIFSSNNR